MAYVLISWRMSPQPSPVDWIFKARRPSILQQSESRHVAIFPYVRANELIAALEEEAVLGVSMSLVEDWVRAGQPQGN